MPPELDKSKMRKILNAKKKQQQVQEHYEQYIEEFYNYNQEKVTKFPEILLPDYQKDLKTVCSTYSREILTNNIFAELGELKTTTKEIYDLLSKLKDSSIKFIEKQKNLNIIDQNEYYKKYNEITEKYKSSAEDIDTLKDNIQTTNGNFKTFSKFCTSFSHSTKTVYALIGEIDALRLYCYTDYGKIKNDCTKLKDEYSQKYKQTLHNLYALHGFHYELIAKRSYNQVPEIHNAEVFKENCEDLILKYKDCKRDLRKKKPLEQHQKWLDQQLEKQIEKLEKEEEPQPMKNYNTENIKQDTQKITFDNLRQQNQNSNSSKGIKKPKIMDSNTNDKTSTDDISYNAEADLLANSRPATKEEIERIDANFNKLNKTTLPKVKYVLEFNSVPTPSDSLHSGDSPEISNIFELSNYMDYMNIK